MKGRRDGEQCSGNMWDGREMGEEEGREVDSNGVEWKSRNSTAIRKLNKMYVRT